MAAVDLPQSVGGVELWWIRRPAPARVTVRTASAVSLILLIMCSVAACWSVSLSGDVSGAWPWSIGPINGAQIVLRYLSVLLVAWGYVVARSCPAWLRLTRQARADLVETERLVEARNWQDAARTLHRYSLLWTEVWRRLPARGRQLDTVIREHLTSNRRLYIYYVDAPPLLPDTPEAGFAPRVVPSAIVGWWTMLTFLVLAATTYAELTGALRSQQWRALRAVNFLVLAACLTGYAYLYLMAVLGKRQYFRFAPGIAQMMAFGIVGTRAKVRSFHLRECDVVLDLTGASVVLATPSGPDPKARHRYHLARKPQVIDACLRAVLSTATVRDLPESRLVD